MSPPRPYWIVSTSTTDTHPFDDHPTPDLPRGSGSSAVKQLRSPSVGKVSF